MGTTVSMGGVNYTVPAVGEGRGRWGASLSAYLIAISTQCIQKSGGSFTLTSELNLGSSYGIKGPYWKSSTANPASAGVVRLAKTDVVAFRNNANGGDLSLGIDGSDRMTFSGGIASTFTGNLTGNVTGNLTGNVTGNVTGNLTGNADTVTTNANLSGDVSSSGNVTTIGAGKVTNSMLAGSIAYSKLALTNSLVNADIASGAAIAYSKLALTSSIVNADIGAAAAIAYSKLNLATSIVNSDVSTSAAIAYSKLNLATSIVNADISASAAIAYSKLALSASIATGDLASGLLVPIGKGGTGQTTAAAAFAALSPLTTKGDLSTYSTTTTRLGVGADGTVLMADSTQTTGIKWTSTVSVNPMTTTGDIIVGGASGAQNRLAVGSTDAVLSVSGGTPAWKTSTGSGSNVLATSPTLVTPVLGTPSSGNLSNCTNYPAATDTTAGTVSYYKEDDSSMSSVTFQGDQGGSASSAIAIKITRVGRVVTMMIPSLTTVVPTNNSTKLRCNTLIPAAFRPSVNKSFTTSSRSNGVLVTGTLGLLFVQTDGHMDFFRDYSAASAYTNSANAGWDDISITYTV